MSEPAENIIPIRDGITIENLSDILREQTRTIINETLQQLNNLIEAKIAAMPTKVVDTPEEHGPMILDGFDIGPIMRYMNSTHTSLVRLSEVMAYRLLAHIEVFRATDKDFNTDGLAEMFAVNIYKIFKGGYGKDTHNEMEEFFNTMIAEYVGDRRAMIYEYPLSYNYSLRYPDNTVFYFGKGTGNRMDQHLYEYNSYKDKEIPLDKGINILKHRVIGDIIKLGLKPVVVKEIDNITPELALQFEKVLIARLTPTKLLVNRESSDIWSEDFHNRKLMQLRMSKLNDRNGIDNRKSIPVDTKKGV